MKTRTITLLWIVAALAASASFVALVLGITNFLARSPESDRAAQVAKRVPPAGGGGIWAEVPNGGPGMVAPPVAVDFGPLGMDFGDGFEDEVMPEPFFRFGAPVAPAAGAGRPVRPEEMRDLQGPAAAMADPKITGPFAHGPLAVFLVHGQGVNGAEDVLTLQEALGQGLATVHEGGISIDNRSGKALFVQSGDIIKGGTQDRVLPNDYLIPAGARRFPVQAFCVESGRSFPRAGEISTSFAQCSERLPTKELRLAAHRRSQAEIWNSVARLQAALSRSVGGDVRAQLSRTSLQLTLEHPLVENGAQEYVSKLIRTPDAGDHVVGMVAAINGRIVSGDVYSSPELFEKFWPKLLKAAAIEAMAHGPRGAAPTLDKDSVREFLTSFEAGSVFRQDTGGLAHLLRREGSSTLVFDTCQNGTVVHRTLLAR